MNITNVEIKKERSAIPTIIAKVNITFDESFVVKNIILTKNKRGYAILMPFKRENGVSKDIVHPLKTETREKIKNAIVKRYEEMYE